MLSAPPIRRIAFAASLACSVQFAAGAPQAAAQGRTTADTVARTNPRLTERDAVEAGAFLVGTALLIPLDRSIAEHFQRPGVQSSGVLSGTATAFNDLGHPLTVFGLASVAYGAGRFRGDDRLTDIGLHTGESVVFAEVIDYAIKGVAGRSRPYVSSDTNPTDFKLLRGFRKGEDYSSFPSGHATAAFAAASALASEGSRWWPNQTRYVTPLAYGGATLVALSRMYSDKHWASDVFLAAGIGTVTARKLVQIQHAHPRNWLDRIFLASSITPTGRGVVVALSPTW